MYDNFYNTLNLLGINLEDKPNVDKVELSYHFTEYHNYRNSYTSIAEPNLVNEILDDMILSDEYTDFDSLFIRVHDIVRGVPIGYIPLDKTEKYLPYFKDLD